MKNKFGFILIKPQLGENIGACARSLKNFGFSKLHIVSPKQSWPNNKAKATSVGAYDVIKKAKIYNNTYDAIKYSVEAQVKNADGVMIIPPFYSTPTPEELINHFKMISKEIDIPIMVYNNPATSNIDISPEIFAELSKIKNVEYCKESTMDVTRVKEIDKQSNGKIKVFGGIMGYESYLNGAIGWVSGTSNIVPQECTNMYENIKIKKIKFKIIKNPSI